MTSRSKTVEWQLQMTSHIAEFSSQVVKVSEKLASLVKKWQ